MGQNWFDLADERQRQREAELAAEAADDVDASPAGEQSPTTFRQLPDDAEPAVGSSRALPPKRTGSQSLKDKLASGQKPRRATSQSGSSMKTAALVIGGVLVAFVVTVSSVAALFSGSTKSQQAVPPTVIDQPQADSKLPALYAGECSDVAGKQRVSASPQTLNGAFAAFQTAYYAGDASSIHSLIDEQSPLAETDWETVLADAGVEGSTWCATYGEAKTKGVDVDLTVTDAQGKQVTYQQRVTGTRVGSHWKLHSISTR